LRRKGKVVLATVKGDVHDIGKNIVGVVLGCNNYDIVDLGVMVPAQRILDAAVQERADIVGLSGLITPSLDEMVLVAKEMQRRHMKTPLLIGGATTSRQHTAVKIAPSYDGVVSHVLDASRAVGVVSTLLDPLARRQFDESCRAEQERLREVYGEKQARPLAPLAQAREQRLRIEWHEQDIPKPSFAGRRELLDYPLEEIAKHIDWTFFFFAWEMKAHYPEILDSPKYGKQARDLFDNGNRLLQRIIDEKLLHANAAYGFWPCNSDVDDLVVWENDTRACELMRFNMLRQQRQKSQPGGPYLSLADFVAPIGSGYADHLGAFAVTAGIGASELAAQFEREHDDYQAIMTKALADRLAEAFAELLHARVRKQWGYALHEDLSNEELIAETYRGIRPAFGYPACPDHTEKGKLFALLGAQQVGMALTESYMVAPGASVSGLYLAHPKASYFSIGRIGKDQVQDYAQRKGMDVVEVERWLMSKLSYDPDDRRSR
jgi:5-methyltetrahydrofolate--homocysteine methyltransferase